MQSQTSACDFVDTDKLILKFIWRVKTQNGLLAIEGEKNPSQRTDTNLGQS